NPVPNRAVTFRVSRSDGLLGNGVRVLDVNTGADGTASVRFTVGTKAGVGNARVRASALGFSGSVEFCSGVSPGPVARVVIHAGDQQFGLVNRPAPAPMEALVTDAGGNPLSQVPVSFTVVAGGGKLSGKQSQ